MVQRRQSEAPEGLLGGFTGILTLSLVLSFAVRDGLVLQIPYGVSAAYAEGFPMIHHIAPAAPLNLSSSWTWNGSSELADNGGISLDFPVAITGADVAAFGGKGRND